MRGDEADVGGLADQPVRRARVPQRGDHGLALGRPGRDRRPLDAEVVPGELDVVQLAAVNEPPGRGVPDLGVILPAVPQPPDHLDVVPSLREQPGDQLLDRRVRAVTQVQRRDGPPPEVCGLVRAGRHPDLDSGPPGADVVECRDGLGDVKRLGVRDDDDRHQPDMAGHRRHPGRGQDGVQPPAYLVGPGVRPAAVRGLQAEPVLDGHEVEQAALGLGDDVGPVGGGEQLGRARPGLAPRGGMPSSAVERDGKSHGARRGDTQDVPPAGLGRRCGDFIETMLSLSE